MAILEVEHLKKTYTTRLGSNRVEALKDVNFTVERGEFVAIMGESGEDLKFSPAARRVCPYSFECKNVEKLNIWSALKQAEENTKVGLQPAVVFRRNHSDAYVAIKLEHFLTLISPKSTLDETTTS